MNIWFIILIVVISVFVVIFVVDRIVKAHKTQATTGREDLIGKIVIVRKALDPEGTVFLEGELWNAVIDKGVAQPGNYVVITKSEGLLLCVKNINEGVN